MRIDQFMEIAKAREKGQPCPCDSCREPMRRPVDASATRFKSNPNWTYRGDNTKYREKK